MIRSSDIVCSLISIVIGMLVSPIGYVFALMYVTYSYLRSTREAYIAVFFILGSSLVNGIVETYFYALGFAIYFMLLYILKYRNKNLYQWLPYTGIIVVSAFAYQAYGIQYQSLLLPIAWFLLMRQLFYDYNWIKKEFMLSKTMQGIVLYSVALCIGQWFKDVAEVMYFVTLFNIIYIADKKTSIVLLLLTYALFEPTLSILFIPAAILCIFKDQKKEAILLVGASVCFLPFNIELYIYLFIGVIGLFLYPQKQKEVVQMPNALLQGDNLMRRQLNNYASIFQLLSDYYSQINNVEAELLSSMSSALQYNADMIRKVEGNDKDSDYIKKALEGYQFEVKYVHMEESHQQDLQMHLQVSNVKRGEIRTTLLPLLEGLLHRKLDIVELHTQRFSNTSHTLTLQDKIPFVIDAYADSVKNSYTSNGDTFSIFRFQQSIVCMISDGMGNGERAMKSSRLITNIFQRMMVSGLTQDNAIRCINKLVQSDTFATLDVLCFNRAQGLAYISKSAACPTFLLRDQEIYEISGNALPVGIVAQIQPDCFQIECKENDEYLMASDGVRISEIKEWLSKRRGISVKEDVELFTQILNTSRRSDDSTIILARVNVL